jgi:hypothetical protein
MKLIILGTEHQLQDFDECLKDLVVSITESEHITLIGEEHHGMAISVARQVAEAKSIPWLHIDMSTEQRLKAGIDEKLNQRWKIRYEADGSVTQLHRYAPREDGIREEFWLERIAENQTNGIALLICGALHARKVADKARQKGHPMTLLFYPQTPGSEFWVSIMPEVF